MTDEPRWINGDLLHCSFCGRSQGECAKLIAGHLVYVCDRCVAQAGGRPAVTDPGRACSFCGKAASTARSSGRPANPARNARLAGSNRSASSPRRRAAGAESPKA